MKKYEGSTRVSPNDWPMFSAVAPDKKVCGASEGERYSARTRCEGFFALVKRVKPSPRLVDGISGWEEGGLDSIKDVSSSFYTII